MDTAVFLGTVFVVSEGSESVVAGGSGSVGGNAGLPGVTITTPEDPNGPFGSTGIGVKVCPFNFVVPALLTTASTGDNLVSSKLKTPKPIL